MFFSLLLKLHYKAYVFFVRSGIRDHCHKYKCEVSVAILSAVMSEELKLAAASSYFSYK